MSAAYVVCTVLTFPHLSPLHCLRANNQVAPWYVRRSILTCLFKFKMATGEFFVRLVVVVMDDGKVLKL